MNKHMMQCFQLVFFMTMWTQLRFG